MSRTDVRQNADFRSENIFQFCHFARFRNSDFKDSQLVFLIDLQQRDRKPNLRVETFGRFHRRKFIPKTLIKPFFYDGFAVASCNADGVF